MIQKLNYIIRNLPCRPIFVIATGRSGTHWLGYTLGNHPEVRATIERQPMFRWSTKMALNPESENRLLRPMVWIYKWHILKSVPRHYLDKSHPNIWIAEKLKKEFPNALFIGIERNPFATVSSMIKHERVSSWHRRWREFQIPNRFLGIDKETAEIYDNLPLASQCALRWLAHHRRMNKLRKFLQGSLMVINYESLACNTEMEICRLQKFLGLTEPISTPEVKIESLDKWKNLLSENQIIQISDIVGFAPDDIN